MYTEVHYRQDGADHTQRVNTAFTEEKLLLQLESTAHVDRNAALHKNYIDCNTTAVVDKAQ